MKTDRELLELAAKAAGINRNMWDYEYCRNQGHMVCRSDMWSPLTDDGDALRLAVKLKLDIEGTYLSIGRCRVYDRVNNDSMYEEEINNDPYAATRRAIVRAAAEIGLKEQSK